MNVKLIFKISVLVFTLILVLAGRKFFMSPGFQKEATEVFAVSARPFQWCSSERKIFIWTEPVLATKYKNQPQEKLAKIFCTAAAEAIQGVDLTSAKWIAIAQAVDSEGQKVILEWDKEKKLFRGDGLPFKSTTLSREINPE